MVLQDAWLFGGTIADNIACGSAGATAERIAAAAQATHVDHFVRTLPDGYDTVLEDEGANVSAGEKQLITIARAFLAEPAILILDEATSSVDTRPEVLIQRALRNLRQAPTTFIIAPGASGFPKAVQAWSELLGCVGEALRPPTLRAAMFEAAAKIPGVSVVQGATDAAGRTGIAVSKVVGPFRYEVIFIPLTYEYMG